MLRLLEPEVVVSPVIGTRVGQLERVVEV